MATNDPRSACEKVLETTELLETRLLPLPLKDPLINAQQSNRTWHATIQQSPSLQRALFFRPVRQPAVKYWGALCSWNRNIVGDLSRSNNSDHRTFIEMKRRMKNATLVRNPFLPYVIRIFNIKMFRTADSRKIIEINRRYCAAQRREVSWRRMLFCLPFVQVVRAWTQEERCVVMHLRKRKRPKRVVDIMLNGSW